MNRFSTRLAFVASLAGLSWTAAPGPWARTLDRRGAIALALAQNPQIAAARAEEAVLEAQRAQVRAAHLPAITLDIGVAPSDIATLIPGTDESVQQQYHIKWSELSAVFLGNLTAIQPLYTFGKIALRGEAALAGLRARQAQTRMKQADVAFAVAQLYEGLLYARDAERFFHEIDHWLAKTLEGTEDRLEHHAGKVSERDVLRLQSAQGLSAMGVNDARAAEAEAKAGLAAYLGLPSDESVEVSEDELLPVGSLPRDVADLSRLAGDHRPELTALREGHKALWALGRAEAAGYLPNFYLLGFVNVAYTPGRDWVENRFIVDPLNHFAPGVVVGARWQLQGAMSGARADEQRAHADVLAHLGNWAEEGIPAEVRKAYETVRRGDQDIERGEEAVKKSKQWMVESSADYDVGLLDIREVSDAVTSYVTLRTALLQARYDRNVGMADLSRATGTLDGDAKIFYLEPPPPAAAPVPPPPAAGPVKP
jgi:outer membrane protein TolC